jgi:hypothetical protein
VSYMFFVTIPQLSCHGTNTVINDMWMNELLVFQFFFFLQK